MFLGVGPVAHMHTCAMYSDVREASWDQLITLSSQTSAEIEFWFTSFGKYNGFPYLANLSSHGLLIFSSASDFVWGSYLVKIGKNIAKGIFSDAEAGSSLTWRELKATLYVLESFVASLANKTVKHRSDKQAVPLVLTSDSKKPHIHQLVLDIFELCIKNSVNLILLNGSVET